MSRQPVRVTHIVFDLDGGGLETLVAEMARRWSGGERVRMSVITLSGRVGSIGESVRPEVEQFHVLEPMSGVSMMFPLGLVRAVRATRPDVVHLHSGAWYKGALAARMAGVPRVIYTEHGREHDDPALLRLLDRIASRWTTRVAAVSDRLRRYMIETLGLDPRQVVTIANGVDVQRFTPGRGSAELRSSLSIDERALVVGSIGRLEPVKAYERLVSVYAMLRRHDFGRPVVLVIFGEGSDRMNILDAARRLGVEDGVRLPGWTHNPTDSHRLMDIFALTSLSEGMSVSLMESMACGACPVVMDVGSNAEVVGAGLANQVVPAGNIEKFEHATAALLASDELRGSISARARAEAESRHSLEGMTNAYERLYRGDTP